MKICCLIVPKHFVEEPFCVSENFWYRKLLRIREGGGGGYYDFRSKFVCLAVPKHFIDENFCFRKIPISKNFMDRTRGEGGGRSSIFCRIFCLTVPKHFGTTISRHINQLKNVGKVWDSKPYLALQNAVVLPTLPWEPLEFLKNVSEIIKKIGTTDSSPDLSLQNPVVLTRLLSFIFEKKNWQIRTEKK